MQEEALVVYLEFHGALHMFCKQERYTVEKCAILLVITVKTAYSFTHSVYAACIRGLCLSDDGLIKSGIRYRLFR